MFDSKENKVLIKWWNNLWSTCTCIYV